LGRLAGSLPDPDLTSALEKKVGKVLQDIKRGVPSDDTATGRLS